MNTDTIIRDNAAYLASAGQARSVIHDWFPYDRVGAVNAVP